MRAVESAIARQVLHGGDLATALLEGDAASESDLTALFAESVGMLPAAGKLAPESPEVLRALPSDLAERHRIFPLAIRRGEQDTLVIATSEPLPTAVEEDLGFALAAALQFVAAPLVRIRQAQATHYGTLIEDRLAKLAARLDERAEARMKALQAAAQEPRPDEGIPPPRSTLRGLSVVAWQQGEGVPVPGAAPLPEEALSWETDQHTASTLVPSSPSPSLAHLLPTPVPSALPTPVPEYDPASELLEAKGHGDAFGGGGDLHLPVGTPPVPGAHVLGGWAQRALSGQEVSPSGQDAPPAPTGARASEPVPGPELQPLAQQGRRGGPFTVVMAEKELAEVETTEAVLDVLFDFAQQFFVYTALFAVQGEVAQGRFAAGPGTSNDDVAALRIGLDAPGELGELRRRGVPQIASLARTAADAHFVRALGRSEMAAAAIVPVSVRGRVVAFVYGDEGSSPVQMTTIGDLIALAALTSQVLEQLILRKKKTRQGPPPAAAPTVSPRGAGDTGAPGEGERGQTQGDSASEAARGPLSERTRSVLMQELRGWRDAVGEPLGDARAVQTGAGHEERVTPDVRAPEETAAYSTSSDVPRPIDDVARAFGLRGTGVEDQEPLSLASLAGGLRRGMERETGRGGQGHRQAEFATAPTLELPMPRLSAGGEGTSPGAASWNDVPGHDRAALVQAVIEDGDDAPRAFAELVRDGEAAAEEVSRRFPGPLRVDHRIRELLAGARAQEELSRLPPASECGPLLTLVVALRRPSLPIMTACATSPDPDIRFWATHVLGELRYPEAANALLPRLFDEDAAIRRVARRAAAALVHDGGASNTPGSSWMPPTANGARRAAAPGAPILQGLEYILLDMDESLPRKLMAIETAAAIRARELVPALQVMLSNSHAFLAEAAARALKVIPHDERAQGFRM
ncbi:HEAT repeat domain-containing protein [Chondromyces crocatus]|uniref:Type II secretion system protein GspE N-terminal domain-containing protein n=1 Tax=Chondromyces crocatus TaxID=52 RepID=A0A0K1EL71_CHOCO|nr:HEAT repeat domain-containing protein [Chondromyces crocatus]AKT41427.1 uncharacterized protein CMC5_056270 [Chondromyces crocatus]